MEENHGVDEFLSKHLILVTDTIFQPPVFKKCSLRRKSKKDMKNVFLKVCVPKTVVCVGAKILGFTEDQRKIESFTLYKIGKAVAKNPSLPDLGNCK